MKASALLSRRSMLFIVGVLLAIFLANALNGAIRNSGVCDELGAHMVSGYFYWTSGTFSFGSFALGHLLIGLPVKLLGLSYDVFTEQHLLLFRLPVLVMGLLLGVIV